MKIIPFPGKYDLAEVGQTNPLRWVVLHRTDGDTFEAQTAQFKCKDFFNDIVAKYHGFELAIYGFKTESIKVNEEGLYLHLHHVAEGFDANLKLVNEFGAKWEKPPVQLLWNHAPTERVIFVPKAYLENTFYISLLTYLIRISNIPTVITDPTFKGHPTKSVDCPFRSTYDKVLSMGYGKLPVESYYFAGPSFNYKVAPTSAEYVHNCGVNSWVSQLMAHKLI